MEMLYIKAKSCLGLGKLCEKSGTYRNFKRIWCWTV